MLSVAILAKLESWKTSFLHTLTFPDPEPSPEEAQRRYRSLYANFFFPQIDQRRHVWALQRGGRTKRLHFHLVTGREWDWAEMWTVLPRYGFGRYDCEVYDENKWGPWHVGKAMYVAKYVANRAWLEPGVRNWGAVGFAKCKQKDVRHDSFELPIRAEVPRWLLCQIPRTSLLDPNYARRKASLMRAFSKLA